MVAFIIEGDETIDNILFLYIYICVYIYAIFI